MSARRFISKALAKALVGSMFFLLPGLANADNEWLAWGHDPERTGSNPEEKILNKGNVSQLRVKWIAQISTAPKEYILSTMTAPVVATVNTPQGPAARGASLSGCAEDSARQANLESSNAGGCQKCVPWMTAGNNGGKADRYAVGRVATGTQTAVAQP
jgi:hypothetical protein